MVDWYQYEQTTKERDHLVSLLTGSKSTVRQFFYVPYLLFGRQVLVQLTCTRRDTPGSAKKVTTEMKGERSTIDPSTCTCTSTSTSTRVSEIIVHSCCLGYNRNNKECNMIIITFESFHYRKCSRPWAALCQSGFKHKTFEHLVVVLVLKKLHATLTEFSS